jgi:ribosomal protein L37AE/L43A
MNCPKCKRKTVRQGEFNFCRSCNAFFDDDPDEGGDFSDRNAAARLERDDRRREKFNKRK